jgi:hypothetical protein
MSAKKSPKNTPVVRKAAPATTARKSSISAAPAVPLIFGKRNYIFWGVGMGLVVIGFLGSISDLQFQKNNTCSDIYSGRFVREYICHFYQI